MVTLRRIARLVAAGFQPAAAAQLATSVTGYYRLTPHVVIRVSTEPLRRGRPPTRSPVPLERDAHAPTPAAPDADPTIGAPPTMPTADLLIHNPRRTHQFRRVDVTHPGAPRHACTDCVFGEFHRVHQLPDAPPDTRYEPAQDRS